MATTKSISVEVPAKLNLAQTQNILASALKKGGCPNCFSGFRISFENEVERFSVDAHTHEVT